MHDDHDWYWWARRAPDLTGHDLHGSAARPGLGVRVPDGDMRVSDVERTNVINALCRHFADGRLDQAELDERTATATAAKTRRDLSGLLADLPPLDQPPVPAEGPPARRYRHPFPLVFAVIVAIIVAASWPARILMFHVPWVLVFVVVLLLLRWGRPWRARL